MRPRIGSRWPASYGGCTCASTFEQKLPTATAADFAPLEGGVIDEDTYVQRERAWFARDSASGLLSLLYASAFSLVLAAVAGLGAAAVAGSGVLSSVGGGLLGGMNHFCLAETGEAVPQESRDVVVLRAIPSRYHCAPARKGA